MGLSLMTELGRMCALDVLLNNFDRLPIPVWDNNGNLSNALVSADGQHCFGIDQQVYPIEEGANRNAYLERVRLLAKQLSLAAGLPNEEGVASIRAKISAAFQD